MTQRFQLKLFVCGMTPVSEQAVANLKQLLEEVSIEWDLTIVDVLDRPDLAESEAIVATPTLLKETPLPRQLFVGDLSNLQQLKNALGIPRETTGDNEE